MAGTIIQPPDQNSLFPGDCLLYRPSSIFGYAIAVKTWTRVSHVEVYAGNGTSYASRDGLGVNCYPYRSKGLAAVLTPGPDFDFEKARRWFLTTAIGQKYGWRTLLTFILLNNNPIEGHMICSEFAAELFSAGLAPLFAPRWEAYRTPPSFFLATPRLKLKWDDGDLF